MEEEVELKQYSENKSTENQDLSDIFAHHFTIYQGKSSSPSKTRQELNTFNAATLFQTAATLLWRDPWHEILKGRLYLGMIPNNNNGHPLFDKPLPNSNNDNDNNAPQIRGLNVAVVEPHAMGGTLIGNLLNTTTLQDYQDNQIHHLWLFIQDHTANVQNTLFIDALMVMRDYYLKEIPINVHCKSGKGRSSMLLIAFLIFMMITGDSDILNLFDDQGGKIILETWSDKEQPLKERFKTIVKLVEKFLQKKRGIVNVNTKRQAIIVKVLITIFEHIKNKGLYEIERSDDFKFLRDFGQSDAYKKLAIYFANTHASHSNSAKIVQLFIDNLIDNEDGWFDELDQATTTNAPLISDRKTLSHLIHKPNDGSDYLTLLTNIRDTLNQLATDDYPYAKFSQQILAKNHIQDENKARL